MSVNGFLVISDWRSEPPLSQSAIKNALYRRLVATLGVGVHEFSSLEPLFEAAGIEYLDSGEVHVRSATLKAFEEASQGIFFRMGKRRFARLIHRMKRVRLVQFSLGQVEREDRPRLKLIII